MNLVWTRTYARDNGVIFISMDKSTKTKGNELATLGGGCFWCTEASFGLIRGVVGVTPGYAGGETANPTYEQVSSGRTGHAEVVQVTFDPEIISYEELLEIFWAVHNPTTPNRQGADVGSQYRSIILAHDKQQYELAIKSRDEVAAPLWDKPVVTEVRMLDKFWPAEEEHQEYFRKNPQAAYCQLVINPKLKKLRRNFADKVA